MLRAKERVFAPLCTLTVEDLVPADHFCRHLEATLDLSVVRPWVKAAYAERGRPASDPVVFFKLQLVMFFEGIRSERPLLRVAAARLSLRWYLGYDLDEALPDRSSLTTIRQRYGLATFRRFFAAIVERCRAAGLVRGKELYFGATRVDANASLDSSAPRFAAEAPLEALFPDQEADGPDRADEATGPVERPAPLPEAVRAELEGVNAERHEWIARAGRPDRTITHGRYQRRTDFEASRTDPDAALMRRQGGGLHFGDHDHYAAGGGKARSIVEVWVTPSDVMENQPLLDLLWRARFRWRLPVRQVTGATTSGTVENSVALAEQGIRADVPLPAWDGRTPSDGPSRVADDAERDEYRCPEGHPLRRGTARYPEEVVVYRAAPAICNACPVKAACTPSDRGRQIQRSFYAESLDRGRGYHQTAGYQKAMRKRGVWVEPLSGGAKDWHGLRRFRLRGLWKVNVAALLIATGQNLQRLLRQRGWGRRPWPNGAPEALPVRLRPLWRLSPCPRLV